jgi:SAM-dependent methyltransferase
MIVEHKQDIFNCISDKDFYNLLVLVNSIHHIDIDYLYEQYTLGNKNLDKLQELWYESFVDDTPDYSLYSKDDYINEGFGCWKAYSRRYIKLLAKLNLQNIRGIIDLGCGIAYSTIGLSAIYNDAQVYGTNIKDTVSFELDKIVCDNIKDIHIVDENAHIDYPIDMIVGFEFFEHIQRPIELLNKLIRLYRPRYFVFANTFTRPAIGHFNKYYDGDNVYVGKNVSLLFSKTLRKYGYIPIDTKFFNNRPHVYMLIDRDKRGKLF